MYKQEQIITESNKPTISKLNEMGGVLALLDIKCRRLREVCRKLNEYAISITPSHIYVRIEEHPVAKLEKAIAKELENCLNDYENLYNAYYQQEFKE